MADLKELREPHLHLRFHTTPTADTRGTTATLEFQGCRYLIGNAHEGLARSLSVAKNSLNNVNDVLLTGKTQWEQQGGMVGLLLTLADARASAVHDARVCGDVDPPKARVRLFGGRNLTYILATARKFVFRQDCAVDVHEQRDDGGAAAVSGAPMWCDENVRVWPLQIQPKARQEALASTSNGQSNGPQGAASHAVEVESATAGDQKGPTPDDQELMMLKSAVSEMFESDWRLDALFETPLSEADLSGAIFMKDAKTGELARYNGPEPGIGLPPPETKVWVRKPWPGALLKELPRPRKSDAAMSYIIKDYPRRGKMDGAKLKAFNVSGPLVGRLSHSRSVTNPEGKKVTLADVTGPEMPACGFAFVDLPSIDYVANLLARPEWQNEDIMTGLTAIVWNLGPGVSQSSQLQAFVQRHLHLKHVVSSPDHHSSYFGFEAASVMHAARSHIDPDRYRFPAFNDSARPLPDAFGTAAVAVPGLKVNLRKRPELEGGNLTQSAKLLEAVANNIKPAILDNAHAVKEAVLGADVQQEIRTQQLPSPDTEIIALGTGAARPSKYRGVSGTLVRVPGIGSYLLDCGENTLGQLGRVYSPDELAEVLRDLRMVFISHMHADHHLGLTSVIRAWNRAVHGDVEKQSPPSSPAGEEATLDLAQESQKGQRLVIASEPCMIDWLREYAAVDDFGLSRLILLTAVDNVPAEPPVTHLRWDETRVSFDAAAAGDAVFDAAASAALRAATGLRRLQVAKVAHCAGAHGATLSFGTGLRVTYSGDCRPSRRLVQVGRGSTLLIHEATFDDAAAAHARAKRHSTVSEALGVADAMGAQRCLLTHVSARYDRGLPMPAATAGAGAGYVEPTLEEPDAEPDDGRPMTDGTVDLATAPVEDPKPLAGDASEQLQNRRFFEPSVAGAPGATPAPRRRPLSDGMKVGLLNDYTRVRLKDIMLLERFAPAMDAVMQQSTADLTRPPAAERAAEQVAATGSPKRERGRSASASSDAAAAAPRHPVRTARRKKMRAQNRERSREGSGSERAVHKAPLSAEAALALARRLDSAPPVDAPFLGAPAGPGGEPLQGPRSEQSSESRPE